MKRLVLLASLMVLLSFSPTASAACTLSCTFSNSAGHPIVQGTGGCGASGYSTNVLTPNGGCSNPPSTANTPFWSCNNLRADGPLGTSISSATMAISANDGGFAQVNCAPVSAPTPPPSPTICPPPYQPTYPPCTMPPQPTATNQPPQPTVTNTPPPEPTATPCPPTYCASFTVTRASSSNPLAGRTFNANCVMNICGSNSYGCPSDPQWSASYGSVNPPSGLSSFWTQSGTSTVTISATVPACGTAQTDYAPATCTLSSIRPVYWTPTQQTDLTADAYTNPATGREFQALCNDQYGETFACPGPVSWTASAGSFTSSPYHPSADYSYWLTSGTANPVTITATSPTCGSATTSYERPICSSVALNPRLLPIPAPAPDLTQTSPIPTENLEFNLQCNDQYGERYPCAGAPAWTIQSGTFTTSSHDATADTYTQGWNATSVYGPYDFTANVAGCGSTTWTYRPPAVCAGINLSYGYTSTEEFARNIGYTSSGGQFAWSPNGLENYLDDLPGKFWGYNWTYEWLNRPMPDWVPYRIFGAACNDQYGQAINCPLRYWNATSGYFENTTSSQIPNRFGLPANAIVWRSGNQTERPNITAVIPYCGKNNLSFDLYVHNACRVIPEPANAIDLCAQYPWIRDDPRLSTACTFPMVKLPNGGASNFTALCRDDALQWNNCLEPNFAWLDSNATAIATSTNYWQGYQYYNETHDLVWHWIPSFMGNSVVTVTATQNDAFTTLTAGGPTHNCKAGIIIGNPALTCTLSVDNATPLVGQTVHGTLACQGLDGPAPCADLDLQFGPGLLVEPTSDTTADLTPIVPGPQNITATNVDPLDPKSRRPMPISCTFVINATPTSTRCGLLPSFTRFGPQTTNFSDVLTRQGHLETVPNLALDNADMRLQYASDVFACGQDFDSAIRTAPGFLALDPSRLHASIAKPAMPVTVTLKNLPYAQTPKLYVFDGFAPDNQTVITMGKECAPANRCQDIQYDSASRTLTFKINGFSSYATAGDDDDFEPLPPNTRFELDCPLPQLGQNLTRVSAFLYVNGTPAYDTSMTLLYQLNQSYAFETYPVLVNPATGRHDFVIDTRYGGTYRLKTTSGNYSSNECRLDVFEQESTPIPELNEWIILAVFLSAGFLATRRKNR